MCFAIHYAQNAAIPVLKEVAATVRHGSACWAVLRLDFSVTARVSSHGVHLCSQHDEDVVLVVAQW